ncbi:MAG: T9SS type A sorting domain-containing protein [Candidatus Brocadia sapporoensis]|nr:T9SS type A sorting domain-containing protein [Candidatus Brocadia sapporoensis]
MKIKITNTIFSLSLMLFIIAFNFQHNPPSGWYQQFLPSLPNMQLSDIFFLDSLSGWAVTGNSEPNDTSGYILKTIDGGDNWDLKFTDFRDFSRVKFLNENTGFVSGGFGTGARLYKSTDGGENWFNLSIPGGGQIYFSDLSVINEDTLWVVANNSLVGGVFRTTNGGISWQVQYSAGLHNPERIYMYDANLGFISTTSNTKLRRTTDGGATWTEIQGVKGFTDLQFIDENTGWKARSVETVEYSTNGGLNWISQPLVQKDSNIIFSRVFELSVLNKDIIWGFGTSWYLFPNLQIRGMIHFTTDGGDTWEYQIPDTAIDIRSYRQGMFINKLNGWAYALTFTGVHTVTGGNITSIDPISGIVPDAFNLYQNYPNPFNPITKIRFDIHEAGIVKLMVHNILGKEVGILVNERLSPGSYEYTFEAGSDLSSGVYFYTLQTGKASVTKRMVFNK